MGTYRSTPLIDKETTNEEASFCKVGSSSMCGWRQHQEDDHVIHLDENMSILAVFDGHGGADVSKYAGENLVKVAQGFELGPETTDDVYRQFVIKLDSQIEKLNLDEQGATSVIAFMFPVESDGDGKKKFCVKVCNSGDSRCVCEASGEILATKDHKPTDPEETLRVQNAGGHVSNSRVMGDLALSRALGDCRYKKSANLSPEKQIITCDPDVYTWYIKENDFFVLACDGIFDVKSNEDLMQFIHENIDSAKNFGELCENLMDDCICEEPMAASGCGADNMSVIIGRLKLQPMKMEN